MPVTRPAPVLYKGPTREASLERRGEAGAIRGGARSFLNDERGALLILTGILLVLGFVILGTTLVQLNANEDKVTRAQRDPLMESVDALVRGFSDGIRGGVELGDTNLEQFRSYSEAQEELFRDTATQVGLYVDTKLNPDPPLHIFTGADKCGSYDVLRSDGGIIIGYERDTLTETVVGAIYTLEFTDGRQTVAMDYYVKIFECTPGELHTFPRGVGQHMGAAEFTDIRDLRDDEDERAGITAIEELTGIDIHTELAHIEIGSVLEWQSPENVIGRDNKHANRPSPPVVDLLPFRLIPTVRMNNTVPIVINDMTLIVDAKHEYVVSAAQALVNEGKNDFLQLKLYRPYDPLDATTLLPYWHHNFTLSNTMTSFGLTPPSPSGDPEWTIDEFTGTRWNVTTVTVGVKDEDHTFQIGYIRPQVVFAAPMGYQMNIELEWDEGKEAIPYSYAGHVVEAVYRIPGATPGEEFQIQAFNHTSGAWDDIGDRWTQSGTVWQTWSGTLSEGHHYVYDTDADVPQLRLVDKTIDDAFVTDRDTVYIDYFVVKSSFIGPPAP